MLEPLRFSVALLEKLLHALFEKEFKALKAIKLFLKNSHRNHRKVGKYESTVKNMDDFY